MVYGRLEWKIGKTWEGGRERDGIEVVEYWESRLLDACEFGRCRVERRDCGEVIKGGSCCMLVDGGGDSAEGVLEVATVAIVAGSSRAQVSGPRVYLKVKVPELAQQAES